MKDDKAPILFDDQPPVIESIVRKPVGSVEAGKPLSIYIEANDAKLSGVSEVFWALDGKEPNGKLDKAEKDEPKRAVCI